MDLSTFLNVPALILAGALILLLIGLLVYAARVAQPTASAVDRPTGPPTGAVAMERKVILTIAMLVGTSLIFLGYGLREPSRQVQAAERLLDTSIGRGISQYTTLCYSCHGEKGQGAVVPGSNPIRVAPPLNRADFQPHEPDERRRVYDLVYKTIQRGRPGTPMPAWGDTDGGALFAEQLNELTLMILNGERVVTFEGRRAPVWELVEEIMIEHVEEGISKMPEQPQVEQLPFYQALNEEQRQGVRATLSRGCGGCHVIPNIPGAAGTTGPSLEGVGARRQIAGGVVPNNSVADLAKWIMDPQELKPGSGMPDLGLSEAESRQIAEYLWTLQQ